MMITYIYRDFIEIYDIKYHTMAHDKDVYFCETITHAKNLIYTKTHRYALANLERFWYQGFPPNLVVNTGGGG